MIFSLSVSQPNHLLPSANCTLRSLPPLPRPLELGGNKRGGRGKDVHNSDFLTSSRNEGEKEKRGVIIYSLSPGKRGREKKGWKEILLFTSSLLFFSRQGGEVFFFLSSFSGREEEEKRRNCSPGLINFVCRGEGEGVWDRRKGKRRRYTEKKEDTDADTGRLHSAVDREKERTKVSLFLPLPLFSCSGKKR